MKKIFIILLSVLIAVQCTKDDRYGHVGPAAPKPAPTPSEWGLVGTIEGWDNDMEMLTDGTWHFITDLEIPDNSEVKFRKNGSWDENFGGHFAYDEEILLEERGPNIKVPGNTYDIYLDPDKGVAWFITDDSYPEKDSHTGTKPSTIYPFLPETTGNEGIMYVWGGDEIPEITIHITKDEWNRLLARFDEFNHNADYFHADFTYKKGNETIFIEDGGVRLRGNTSRRRPEGNTGENHNTDNADWHHCHFGINFRKFHKDSEHTIHGIRKVNLKWFKDDPCYVRELYCYDLFRRYGIWTSAFTKYCRVWLDVEGDSKPAYYGVYNMIEPIDDEFIERRTADRFMNDKGFLWKCGYGEGGSANLRSTDDINFNWDQNNGVNYTYEFKGKEKDFETAKAQLKDFISKLNNLSDSEFHRWIKTVCDVEFLLKTYAVNVAVGMWDDLWINGNNYYLYFNSEDTAEYKVWMLPYDYDNTLGTSLLISDAGRQNPYDWGDNGLLMERIMKFDDFKKIYRNALKELIDPQNALFDMHTSVTRIKGWQSKIAPYIENDTGEDMVIEDRPASWGNHNEYRLMDTGNNNFFRVKAESINAM